MNSNSISISVAMDRKAALLAGRVVGGRETIEVSPDTIGPVAWPVLVGRLDMSQTPPVLQGTNSLAEPTVAALRAEIERELAAAAAEKAQQEKRTAEIAAAFEAAIAATRANPWVPQEQCTRAPYDKSWSKGSCYEQPGDRSFAGVTRKARTDLIDPRASIYEYRLNDWNNSEIAAENARIFASVLAERRAEWEALDKLEAAAAAAKKAQAEAEAKAARLAKFARRLETGYWERETDSYNERRYSAPWCAKVTFPNGAKHEYEFGDSTGKWGKAGLLRVACEPGEIIAWGQKDLRRPGNSTHKILIMRPDGGMDETDKTGAWRHWQAQQTTPAL